MVKIKAIEIPLIQNDLKQSETIVQIANTLDILKHSIDNVFSHVHKSIDRTKQSLDNVHSRHKVVCEQIEQLKTIQKAVTIQSSSKYPYQTHKNYEIDFEPRPAPKFKKYLTNNETDVKTDHLNMENKLKFYHVKTHDMLRKNIEVACDETLGKVPDNIDSITSCMLFNTVQNVYEKYVIIDPLSTSKNRIKEEKENIKQIKMEEAPKSLNQDEHCLVNKQSYVYTPSVESVPFIDLPLDLPDLTGFADDFRYTGDDDDLLRLNKGSEPKSVVPIISQTHDIANEESTSQIFDTLNSGASKQTAAQGERSVETSASISASTASSNAPPPPPPLPPPSPPPVRDTPPVATDAIPTRAMPPPASSDSLHSNLMEAIRNAGGTGKAQLKTVGTSGKVENNSSSVSKPTSGGDLMSDLEAKLLLRRKGISGGQANKTFEKSLIDDLLHKVPPPSESSSSEDDNENNDAEWED